MLTHFDSVRQAQMADATSLYTEGEYREQHPDWHLDDSPGKAMDLMRGVLAVVDARNSDTLKVADIGAGVGGVLVEVVKNLNQVRPSLKVEPIGFEVSPFAVEAGRKLFPNLDLRQKFFDLSDGDFDAVLFVDVLEHLENPWDLLRKARATSEYMIVRQPLLENFSTFRHNNYRNQRQEWGHIGYFNYNSFMDMATAAGWKPFKVELSAAWELAGHRGRDVSPLHKLFVRANRKMASYFLSGFYLNGAFQRLHLGS
jgi:SAM-dependent methyltransferase